MRPAILSTYAVRCGIAEYARYLRNGFIAAGDHPVVFGPFSEKYTNSQVAQEMLPTFWVQWLDGRQDYNLDHLQIYFETLTPGPPDALFVQYQCGLYSQEFLQKVLDLCKKATVPTAITYHDHLQWPGFDFSQFNVHIKTREDLPGNVIIPHGIEYEPPLIGSFGLGRNQDNLAVPVCASLGFRYKTFYGSTASNWLTQEELVQQIKSCDAIVLYYPEIDAAGCSLAAQVAIGAKRPVFVSDNSWFKHLEEGRWIKKCQSPDELKQKLQAYFHTGHISWEEVARRYKRAVGL